MKYKLFLVLASASLSCGWVYSMEDGNLRQLRIDQCKALAKAAGWFVATGTGLYAGSLIEVSGPQANIPFAFAVHGAAIAGLVAGLDQLRKIRSR